MPSESRKNPIVLLHGYSDNPESFRKWYDYLSDQGHDPKTIHLAKYVTLSNEITIKDIAEGFDRALRDQVGLDNDQQFDVIVHSTGMLVIRSWLTTYAGRRRRIKRLIGLAPATYGSPLAHKGQSWIGGVFKGNREWGPDFWEAGTEILRALELGSRFQWDLAEKDLLAETPVYGPDVNTPYPFILIGLDNYGSLIRTISEGQGSDGVVRWAGAGFNTRRITIDLTRDPARPEGQSRIQFNDWKNERTPFALLANQNHSTILSEPTSQALNLVARALQVESREQYDAVREQYRTVTDENRASAGTDAWQQFIVRMVDEREDPIPDYYVELWKPTEPSGYAMVEEFDLDVHPYSRDESYRCFHVNLSKLETSRLTNLAMRIVARAGSTNLVGYHGFGSEKFDPEGNLQANPGPYDAVIDMTDVFQQTELRFFYPDTTTLVEIRMNRDPLPFVGPISIVELLTWT